MLNNNEKENVPMNDVPDSIEASETIDNSEEIDEITDESLAEKEISAETSENEIAEEAQEHTEESEESEEEYDNYTVEDDDENFAAVAERITGARHTIASTAAPIRIREETGRLQTAPKPTAGIPTREAPAQSAGITDNVDNSTVQTSENAKASPKHTFVAIIASAVVLIALLSAVVVAVNRTSDENRQSDINVGETIDGAQLLTPPENESESDTVEPDVIYEVDETVPQESDAVETDEEIDESVAESEIAETEPIETEPETEVKVEPVRFTVTLDFYDREDITVATEAITLADLLTSVECSLTDADVPSVALDSMIAADMTITIGKREYKTETLTEAVAYQTEVIEVDTIPRDTTNYIQYGENGEVTKTYTVEYLNGVEQNRTLSDEQTTKWPVNEKYELGVGGSFVGADGVTYTYSHRKVVPATYYNIEGLTYLGTMADETVIAVDRSYIPLGTKLYVKNDNYDFGVRIASDVGSMIDEWEIDIWMDESNPQFSSFAQIGYHYDMEIYYID